jgi:hypothetical protein
MPPHRRADRSVDFSVIDIETGSVLRSGTSQFRDLQAQAGPGEAVIEGRINDLTHRVTFDAFGPRVVRRPAPNRTVEDVRSEAGRRIEARYPVWRQLNAMAEGGEPVVKMRAFIDALRAASNRIERMTPIPFDFTDDKYWTGDNDA